MYHTTEDTLTIAEANYKGLTKSVKERIKREKELAKASSTLEESLKKLRLAKDKVQIVKVIEYANPDYNCPVPSTGVVLLNSTIADTNRASSGTE